MSEKLTLENMDNFSGRDGPLVLIIMDGIGIGKKNEDNALYLADTPFLDKITENKSLYVELKAHGKAVGLPFDDNQGNSEVGHNAIGAGKIVKQRALLAKDAIESQSLFESEKWKNLIKNINEKNKKLHFIGLLSDGYVHSHISHLFGLLDASRSSDVREVRIHPLLDGRDVPNQSALVYIEQLNEKLLDINKSGNFHYKIASGGGRMHVTMDRYNSDWKVVKRGWNAHVCAIPEKFPQYEGYFLTAQDAITKARILDPDISDQYLPSFVITNRANKPIGIMQDGDGVIFFNFRGDRAIEISRAFDEKNFSEFQKKCNPNVIYYGLLQYDDKKCIPNNYFIDPPKVEQTLATYLCSEKINMFSIAETHKFGHTKYFFLGNRDQSPCPEYDEYVEIKSDPSEIIEENPEMKAYKVKDRLLEALNNEKYKFLRVNFANGDMVGHTGNIKAAQIAAETVDECVKEIAKKVEDLNGIALLTADHGNLEEMKEFGTSHTLNPVMFKIIDSQYNDEYDINKRIEEPMLANIAATILNLLGYKKPDDFMESLITF